MSKIFEEDKKLFKRILDEGLPLNQLGIVAADDGRLHSEYCSKSNQHGRRLSPDLIIAKPTRYFHEECYERLKEDEETEIVEVTQIGSVSFKVFLQESEYLLAKHNFKKVNALTFDESIRLLESLEITPHWLTLFSSKTYKKYGYPSSEEEKGEIRTKIAQRLVNDDPAKVQAFIESKSEKADYYLKRAQAAGTLSEVESLFQQIEQLISKDKRVLLVNPLLDEYEDYCHPYSTGVRDNDRWDEDWQERSYHVGHLLHLLLIKQNKNSTHWQVPFSLIEIWGDFNVHDQVEQRGVIIPAALNETELLTFDTLVAAKNYNYPPAYILQETHQSVIALRN